MSNDQPTAHDVLRQMLERLQRIEESQAFAERTDDALTHEIRELDRRVRDLSARIDRLDGRLGELRSELNQTDDAPPEGPV